MNYFDKSCEEYEKNKTPTERFVFLKLFLPKNINRMSPLVYIFMFSLFAMFVGLLFLHFLWVLAVLGGFIVLIFGLFYYFFTWPLIG